MRCIHKILIVDDEAFARKFIANLIPKYLSNAKIRKISNSKKALFCLQNEDYDMMFLDIKMPGMSGLELLEQVRLMGKDLFTVFITAHSKFDYAVKGIELGVVKYIIKPLTEEKIHGALDLYLKKTKATTIIIKIANGVRHIKIDSIIALETVSRGLIKIYTKTSIYPYVTGTLTNTHKLLPSDFFYIRRDCIINRTAIIGYNIIEKEVIVMINNQEVSFRVSRGRWKEVTV